MQNTQFRTLKPLLDVNLYHDSHYNRAVSPKLAVHRARVCTCEMAFVAIRNQKPIGRIPRALRIVNRLAKESSTSESKLEGLFTRFTKPDIQQGVTA